MSLRRFFQRVFSWVGWGGQGQAPGALPRSCAGTPARQEARRCRPSVPRALMNVETLCHGKGTHHIPVRMRFIGGALSSNGRLMAIYACPHDRCRYREGYVLSNGRPRRLWGGLHHGR